MARKNNDALKKQARNLRKQGLLQREIAEKLKLSRTSVHYWTQGIDCPGRSGRRYVVNDSYFSTPYLENSYWAGFIAGDGCVHSEKGMITLNLQKRDISVLETFKKHCEFCGNIRHMRDKIGYESVGIGISSKKWLLDLENNFNITPRKSLTLRHPELSEENELAFIKGLFDADGCWFEKTPSWCIGGTENMLTWIQEIIDSNIQGNVKCTAKVRKSGKNKKCYQYAINGSRAIRWQALLRTVDTPELGRKWLRRPMNTKCIIISKRKEIS